LSDQVSTNILALQLNGVSEVSGTVGVALSESEAIHLYVTEVDANGTPVAQNADFAYEVTVSGSEVTMDYDNTSAAVTITNQMKPDETSETEKPKSKKKKSKTTEEETETTTESQTTTTSPKTGDTTPIASYLLLMAMAAISMLIAQTRRKQRR
jgi:hypothetical protein